MLYKCRKLTECSASYQQYLLAKIISNCCDTVNGADIELIIVGCRFSLLAINGGVVSNIKIIRVPYVLWSIL